VEVAWMDAARLLAFVSLVAFLFARAEVHIEGPHGWAGKLPTWRVEDHQLLNIFFGGKPLTGYHLWMFLFMAGIFHLPLAFFDAFSIKLEARVLGSLMLFWLIEDFLWFVTNPAYGLKKFKDEHISWHNHWAGPVPVDYVVGAVLGTTLLVYSFAHAKVGV